MDKKRWLIITDLDGTALRDHENFNVSTKEVLMKAIDQGHIVCIATGRPPRAALKFYNELKLDTLMANYNGSIICNPKDETFDDMNFMINKEVVQEIMNNPKFMNEIGHWMMERKDHIRTNQSDGFLFDYFFVKNEIDEIVDTSKKIFVESDKNSVIVEVKNKKNMWKVREQLEKFENSIVLRPWSLSSFDSGIIEINSKRGNKGNALKMMAQYYNIPLNRTICFGDMPNDLEMIKNAGVGVVMANANNELKEAANIILTKTNKEDGIAEFLKNNLGL